MENRFPVNTTNNLIATGKQLAEGMLGRQDLENSRKLAVHFSDGLKLDAEIKDLLQHFNNGVQNSFSDGGMQRLERYTTADGFVRMQQRYVSWRERQIKALNLISCQFFAFNVLPGGDKIEAFTLEKWQFVYENGEEVFTKGNVDGYDIRLVDGHWLVEKAETFVREA